MARRAQVQPTPLISLEGCNENAFILLMRAKKVLYARGSNRIDREKLKAEVEEFASRAGATEIMMRPTNRTPVEVYKHVLSCQGRARQAQA